MLLWDCRQSEDMLPYLEDVMVLPTVKEKPKATPAGPGAQAFCLPGKGHPSLPAFPKTSPLPLLTMSMSIYLPQFRMDMSDEEIS